MTLGGRGAAIVGVAECDLGQTGLTKLELHAQGVSRAMSDAGLSLSDVDGLATNGISRFSSNLLAEELGIQPRWSQSSFTGGSSWEMYLGQAADAIASGRAEVVLVSYANDQRSARSRKLGGVEEHDIPRAQFEVPYGPLYPLAMYAFAATRHFHDHGTSQEDLAAIAVAARKWALKNPKAWTFGKGELTVDDVLASDPIATPLKKLDCCLVTDGGGAVVLTSLDRARDLRDDPVVVLGHGEATTHESMAGMPDLTVTGARESGARAFAMAGLTPADVDVAELYDSFTITVATSLEALGFCEPGGFGEFVADGRIEPGGDFPLNTSGGGLSYNHPGQYGILLAVEAVRQLRGECGDRQVPGRSAVDGPEVALCHGTGGILSHHATVLLGVDR